MRFFPGFIAGAVVGGFVVSKMTPDQRHNTAQFVSKAASKARSTQVGAAIVDGVTDITESAGERASTVVTAGTNAIAGTVAPDGSTGVDDVEVESVS